MEKLTSEKRFDELFEIFWETNDHVSQKQDCKYFAKKRAREEGYIKKTALTALEKAREYMPNKETFLGISGEWITEYAFRTLRNMYEEALKEIKGD